MEPRTYKDMLAGITQLPWEHGKDLFRRERTLKEQEEQQNRIEGTVLRKTVGLKEPTLLNMEGCLHQEEDQILMRSQLSLKKQQVSEKLRRITPEFLSNTAGEYLPLGQLCSQKEFGKPLFFGTMDRPALASHVRALNLHRRLTGKIPEISGGMDMSERMMSSLTIIELISARSVVCLDYLTDILLQWNSKAELGSLHQREFLSQLLSLQPLCGVQDLKRILDNLNGELSTLNNLTLTIVDLLLEQAKVQENHWKNVAEGIAFQEPVKKKKKVKLQKMEPVQAEVEVEEEFQEQNNCNIE